MFLIPLQGSSLNPSDGLKATIIITIFIYYYIFYLGVSS